MECAFTKAFKVDPVTVELTYYNPTHPTMRGFITSGLERFGVYGTPETLDNRFAPRTTTTMTTNTNN